jgi:hypothetical protein
LLCALTDVPNRRCIAIDIERLRFFRARGSLLETCKQLVECLDGRVNRVGGLRARVERRSQISRESPQLSFLAA